MRTVAALYVLPDGPYAGLPDVEIWDEARDAREYAGPHRVVAHPPCARWCQLAGLVEARWGHRRGDDGGMFASALAAVRKWGGVLEHPAWSTAWPAHGLTPPSSAGGWTVADFRGGWTCHVEQRHYGHRARKATWLYAVNCELPSLRWGPAAAPEARISWCENHGVSKVEIMGKRECKETPLPFRDVLLSMARLF